MEEDNPTISGIVPEFFQAVMRPNEGNIIIPAKRTRQVTPIGSIVLVTRGTGIPSRSHVPQEYPGPSAFHILQEPAATSEVDEESTTSDETVHEKAIPLALKNRATQHSTAALKNLAEKYEDTLENAQIPALRNLLEPIRETALRLKQLSEIRDGEKYPLFRPCFCPPENLPELPSIERSEWFCEFCGAKRPISRDAKILRERKIVGKSYHHQTEGCELCPGCLKLRSFIPQFEECKEVEDTASQTSEFSLKLLEPMKKLKSIEELGTEEKLSYTWCYVQDAWTISKTEPPSKIHSKENISYCCIKDISTSTHSVSTAPKIFSKETSIPPCRCDSEQLTPSSKIKEEISSEQKDTIKILIKNVPFEEPLESDSISTQHFRERTMKLVENSKDQLCPCGCGYFIEGDDDTCSCGCDSTPTEIYKAGQKSHDCDCGSEEETCGCRETKEKKEIPEEFEEEAQALQMSIETIKKENELLRNLIENCRCSQGRKELFAVSSIRATYSGVLTAIATLRNKYRRKDGIITSLVKGIKSLTNLEITKKFMIKEDAVGVPRDFRILREICKCLLVSWKTPENIANVVGYQIFIDGNLKTNVRSSSRTEAILSTINISKTMEISLYSVGKKGQLSAPVTVTYPPRMCDEE